MITVSGILQTPAGQVLANTEIKFYSVATGNNVLQGTTGIITTGSDGSYSVTLQEGSHRVTVRQGNTRPESIGTVHISAGTTASTLNELLLAASAASPGSPLADEILAARDRAETAATTAEAAQAQTQALRDQTAQISGLDTVAEAIGLARLPEPDVLITFNDGLRIERGYGTHDQIDVSATQNGSVMVDLPTRSVDFSRASSASSINKSGEMVTVGTDAPVIGTDGLQVFGSFTNYLLHSNHSTHSQLGVTAALQTDGWLLLTEDTTSFRQSRLRLDNINIASTSELSYTVRVRPKNGRNYLLLYLLGNGSNSIEFNTDDLSWVSESVGTGNTVTGSIRRVGVNEYELSIAVTVPSPVTSTAAWIFFSNVVNNGNSSYTGGGVPAMEVNHGRLVPSVVVPPLITTTGTAVTRSPDVVSIPVRNNLPASGQPFTLVIDTALPLDTKEHGLFQVNIPTGLFLARRQQLTGRIDFYYATAAGGTRFISAIGIDDKRHRFVFRIGMSMGIFIDGVSSAVPITLNGDYPTLDINNTISIGKWSSNYLCEKASLLTIYHTELSDEQIAALGGPQ